MSRESWFSQKSQIYSIEVYKTLYPEIKDKIQENISVFDILEWIENEVKAAFQKQYNKLPKPGAINNCRGRWNEFIITSFLAQISIDLHSSRQLRFVPFQLPNSTQSNPKTETTELPEAASKFLEIFKQEEFQEDQDLHNISTFKNKIFFSSPDYILSVINNEQVFHEVELLLKGQAEEAAYLGTEVYNLLRGKLSAKEVKAVASVKISNRPDRRYQALYETAMIKAIAYASNQSWKYYMITAEESSPSDLIIFTQGIAPHGIALNQELKSVDQVYSCSNKQDLVPVVEDALSS